MKMGGEYLKDHRFAGLGCTIIGGIVKWGRGVESPPFGVGSRKLGGGGGRMGQLGWSLSLFPWFFFGSDSSFLGGGSDGVVAKG